MNTNIKGASPLETPFCTEFGTPGEDKKFNVGRALCTATMASFVPRRKLVKSDINQKIKGASPLETPICTESRKIGRGGNPPLPVRFLYDTGTYRVIATNTFHAHN